jgi:hypothetical protein
MVGIKLGLLFVLLSHSSYTAFHYFTIFTMRSFYILIPTLAIANMGGANAQLQKAGAKNIRSGVVQRAIAITGKRQVHSADFSSSPPSPDGVLIDPLRSNQGQVEKGESLDKRLVAKRDFLSGLSQGFYSIFGHASSASTVDESQASSSNVSWRSLGGSWLMIKLSRLPSRSISPHLKVFLGASIPPARPRPSWVFPAAMGSSFHPLMPRLALLQALRLSPTTHPWVFFLLSELRLTPPTTISLLVPTTITQLLATVLLDP